MLTQDNLLDDLEAFELDEFRLYQVSIAEIERRAGLRLATLRTHDDFETGAVTQSVSERLGSRPVREVMGREDLVRPT